MSELTYKGPSSTLFLSKDKSRPLVAGQTYSDLDEAHPQVKNLIAHKLLVKEAGAKSQPKEDTVKADQTKGEANDQNQASKGEAPSGKSNPTAKAAADKEGSEQ